MNFLDNIIDGDILIPDGLKNVQNEQLIVLLRKDNKQNKYYAKFTDYNRSFDQPLWIEIQETHFRNIQYYWNYDSYILILYHEIERKDRYSLVVEPQSKYVRLQIIEGRCHLCGEYKPLTFEHIPPRSSFNNRKIKLISPFHKLKVMEDILTRPKIFQGGFGKTTLCSECNGNLGDWYVNAFKAWSYQGMEILQGSKGKPSLIYPFKIYPSLVLKQIIAMFLNINSILFRDTHLELVNFVRMPKSNQLSNRYRVFVYYNIEGNYRYIDLSILGYSKNDFRAVSEITHPPFGYVLTIDSEPPDTRLIEISHFANYEYDHLDTLYSQLPVLPTYTIYPGEYQPKLRIHK